MVYLNSCKNTKRFIFTEAVIFTVRIVLQLALDEVDVN